MTRRELEIRTKKFHIRILQLCMTLPRNAVGFETCKQLVRCAGSVAANYRATARAKSTADFIHKLGTVLEEADESLYWLEIIQEVQLSDAPDVNELLTEASELTSIFAASIKTIKQNKINLRS